MSLLFLPAVCKDRLDAMKKPMEYNTRNQKKRSFVIYGVCAVVAIFASIPNLFRLTVQSKDGEYFVEKNVDFLGSTTAIILRALAPLLRTSCAITSGVLSVMVARYYHRVNQDLKADVQAGIVNETESKMIHERNLAILLLAQVLLCLIGYLPLNVNTFLAFFLPNHPSRPKQKFLVFAEVFAQASFSWNVLIYVGMSHKFRKELFYVVKHFFWYFCSYKSGNTVHVL